MRVASQICTGLSGALLVLTSSTAAAADDSAADWLLRMSEAARSQNYQGVMVYRDAQMFETLKLVHRNRDGQERERLVSLNGDPHEVPREIQREDDKLTCLLPKQRKITAERPGFRGLFPRMTREMVQQFSEYYVLQMVGSARIAGRVCRGIQIMPRDGYRYGYEFWADEEHGIPLKVRLLSGQGRSRVLEELVFTQVEYPETIADAAFAPAGPQAPNALAKAAARDSAAGKPTVEGVVLPAAPVVTTQAELGDSRWVFGQLPPGFRIALRDRRPLPNQRGMLEHTLLSDGLSTISVFSARQPPNHSAFRGLSHMGAISAYGRSVGDFHIAVVGEVPVETVRMIGDGLRAASPSPDEVPESAPAQAEPVAQQPLSAP